MLRNQRCTNANDRLNSYVGAAKTGDSKVNVCVATCLQIAASGNALFLKTKESEEQSLIHLNFSNIEKGEKKPLLQHGNRH